jgi:hypothetical protein
MARVMGNKHSWTQEDDNKLRELYPNTYNKDIAKIMGLRYCQITTRAETLGLRKTEEFLRTNCRRFVDSSGIEYRFKKGIKSWNSGTKGLTGSNKTSFKKGIIPHNTRNDGDLSIRRKDITGECYI